MQRQLVGLRTPYESRRLGGRPAIVGPVILPELDPSSIGLSSIRATGGSTMLLRLGHLPRVGRDHRLIASGSSPLLIALLVAALVTPGAVAAAEPRAAGGPLHDGIFLSVCAPSHAATDDPIVHPGDSGASHQHEFFGNRTTDADSTYSSLRAGGTTCRIAADTAAYWVPALYDDGQRIAPLKVNAYYLRGGGRGPVAAFPAGLKVIAGNSGATTPQARAITDWKCSGIRPLALSADPVACPTGSRAVLVIRFPDCWNGKDLDSVDHRGHMAYRVRGRCPSGYPVRVPRLSLNVHYQLSDVTGLTRASGSIYSSHADFFNAWNQATLARLVRTNLN